MVVGNFLKCLARRTVAVILLFFLGACSTKVALFEGLSQEDANEVYSLLIRSGFSVEKENIEEGYSILVPQSMAGEALDLLKVKGVPKEKKQTIESIFPNDTMISSPLQDRARYLYALSQELERTLMTIDGVIEARVHIVLPERTSARESMTPSSVAVFVTHDPSSPFSSYKSQIRNLVISSVPKMSASDARDNVSIVSIPASNEMTAPLSLVWYGPLAIKASERLHLLGFIYLLVAMWMLSLLGVYLSCVEPDRRPKIIRNLLESSKLKSSAASDAENGPEVSSSIGGKESS